MDALENIGITASSRMVTMLRNSSMLTVPRLRGSKILFRSASLPSMTVADDSVRLVFNSIVVSGRKFVTHRVLFNSMSEISIRRSFRLNIIPCRVSTPDSENLRFRENSRNIMFSLVRQGRFLELSI